MESSSYKYHAPGTISNGHYLTWDSDKEKYGGRTGEFLYKHEDPIDRDLPMRLSCEHGHGPWLVGTTGFHRGCVEFLRVASEEEILTMRKFEEWID